MPAATSFGPVCKTPDGLCRRGCRAMPRSSLKSGDRSRSCFRKAADEALGIGPAAQRGRKARPNADGSPDGGGRVRSGLAWNDPRVLRKARAARGAARGLRRHARRKLGRKPATRGALVWARCARLQVRCRRAAQDRPAVCRLLAVLSFRRGRGFHEGRRDAQ